MNWSFLFEISSYLNPDLVGLFRVFKIMLEPWNLARKYTRIRSFSKYTF